MKYSFSEIKRRAADTVRKGITNHLVQDLIDTLWRDPFSNRTSGFDIAGADDAVITFDNVTRTLTIAPAITRFAFWQYVLQIAYFKRTETFTLQIPDEEGIYLFYIYRDEADQTRQEQKLFYTKNPTAAEIEEIYLQRVIVCWIYWDATNKEAIYNGDETHGSEWNPQIHWWAHGAFNALRDYGLRITDLTIGDGSKNSHARVGISEGAAWHEDLYHTANAVASDATMPILYQAAAGPRFTTNNGFLVVNGVGARLVYNNSGAMVGAKEGSFLLVHLFWTNCKINPFIAVMPQAEYDLVTEAIEAAADELEAIDSWIPQQTKLLISTLVFETSDDFTNSVKARIVGELTPEGIADIITGDKILNQKTGWNPEILEQIVFNYDEVSNYLGLDLVGDWTTYFVKGIKKKVTADLNFTSLFLDGFGLHYVTGIIDQWSNSTTPWDEHTNDYVKAFCYYRNTRQSQTQYLGWRMHTWEIDGKVRGNMIKKTGLEHLSGLELSINATNAHEIDVTEGSLRLAEIVANITHNTGLTFSQFLTSLRARRHFLLTYTDNTDPQNPIITHEWEYQDTPVANVAKLSAGNEVQINELSGTDWVLTDTADDDYTAMWLIATLDYAYPLKWLTGTVADADLATAKELNNAESIKAVIDAAGFICDHYQVIARVMVKNIAASPYYELIEITKFDDGEFDKELTDRHVTAAEFDNSTRKLTLKRNDNLEDLQVDIPGSSVVETEHSVTGDGSTGDKVRLVNDALTPGIIRVYGTSNLGAKGWRKEIYLNAVSFTNGVLTYSFTATATDLNADISSLYSAGGAIDITTRVVKVDIIKETDQPSPTGSSYVLIQTAAGDLYRTQIGNLPSSSTSPAGNNYEIQYNNSGAFGASSNFTFDKVSAVAIKTTTSAAAGLLFYKNSTYYCWINASSTLVKITGAASTRNPFMIDKWESVNIGNEANSTTFFHIKDDNSTPKTWNLRITKSGTTTINFGVYDTGNIYMLGNVFASVSTGAADNDKLVTQGYVDDGDASDNRLKKKVRPITRALETIKKLRGVTFSWRKTNKKSIGFIAQEFETVIPELVQENSKGLKRIDYRKVTALLVEGIKEQQKEIELLKVEIEKLKKC